MNQKGIISFIVLSVVVILVGGTVYLTTQAEKQIQSIESSNSDPDLDFSVLGVNIPIPKNLLAPLKPLSTKFSPTPSPTPTSTPSSSPTSSPLSSPLSSPQATPSPSPRSSSTPTPRSTPTPSARPSVTPTPTPRPTPTPSPVPPPVTSNRTVFAHYYSWYSAPPRTANYRHWDGGENGCGSNFCPPDDIQAGSYPVLNPYDSQNVTVLDWHMRWMKMAKVDVIATSWWGKGSNEDNASQKILDAANPYGLKVSFTIEPYNGRSAASIVEDIKYIYSKYGSHPAFFKMSRSTKYGPNTSPRGLFFIYALAATSDVAPAFDSIRGTADDAIILPRMNDGKLFSDSDVRTMTGLVHSDGLSNYSTVDYKGKSFPKSSDYMLIYSASPGFDSTRYNTSPVVSRENGAFYDRGWQALVNGKVEGVAILSFNEWHETTQIEPAKPFSSARDSYKYQDYTGHFPGLSCINDDSKYLCATGNWVSKYKQ